MRFLRDPLIVFLLIGGGIFLLYAKVTPEDASGGDRSNRIEITDDLVNQLKSEWTARWSRPPTDAEFKGLLDSYVEEEVLYREAKKLGLDQSDSVIRNRLAQKMEFLSSDVAALAEVSDEQLQEYYRVHADRYREEAELGFQHIYFSPDKRQARTEDDAMALLTSLKDEEIDFEQAVVMGDEGTLGSEFATTSLPVIGRQFGEDFVNAIKAAELDKWIGPVPSGNGVHLVKVLERIDERLPPFDEIKEDLLDDYRLDRQEETNKATLEGLMQQYEVVFPSKPGASEAP